MFLDPLPQPLPHLAIDADESTADIFAGPGLGHECESRLTPLSFDAKKLELAFDEGLCFQPIGGGAAAIFAVSTLRDLPFKAGRVDQVIDRISLARHCLAELEAAVGPYKAGQDFPPILKRHVAQVFWT
jgi:hypothetical protein